MGEWLNKLGVWSWGALGCLIGLALFVTFLIPLGAWVATWVTTNSMFVIAISVAVMAVGAGHMLTHGSGASAGS